MAPIVSVAGITTPGLAPDVGELLLSVKMSAAVLVGAKGMPRRFHPAMSAPTLVTGPAP